MFSHGKNKFKIADVDIGGFAALAPMAGVTDRAFRKICVDFGASYIVTEMISAKGILYNSTKSEQLMVLDSLPCPAAIQLFGDDPDTIAHAAKVAMKYSPNIIDINMGCPAPKISGNGSGCALMKNPKLCGKIVSAVKSFVNVPITVKIRKGWDSQSISAIEVAKYCEYNGADAITVHGRTREQFYSGNADLETIAKVKQAVNIPVIGNGDIFDVDSAVQMYEQTACDYIMIGRGSLGNPWLFKQINEYFNRGRLIAPPSIEKRLSVMLEHVRLLCKYKGERIGIKEARKHIGWYIKGIHNATVFRNEASNVTNLEDVKSLVFNIRSELADHGL